ncbi:MAG TPA: carboxymuconolactone decarboxylase family protein [Thermoplasmata archaeon]|nr:carboxymuconolactone decarboxylase family protein [Thermoplasmata archaeon]
MPRIKQLSAEEAQSWTKKLYKKVEDSLGSMPNMFKCMGNSDVGLDGFLALNAGINSGKLGPKNVKMIILLTSQLNDCEYCVAAHTKMALDSGLLSEKECINARKAIGPDEKTTKMLEFAKKVKLNNGKVSDEDVEAVKKAGFDDQEIIEMIGSIALITFANYVSNVAQPDLDFPEVPIKLD